MTTTLTPPKIEFEESVSDLQFALSLAHSYSLSCDEEDALDAEDAIREAIKIIEADYPALPPVKLYRPKFTHSKFSRGMDYSERLESIEELMAELTICMEYAAESGYEGTDVSGYIADALETAHESQVYLYGILVEEKEQELKDAQDAYYRAAI